VMWVPSILSFLTTLQQSWHLAAVRWTIYEL
jgi:hypothetical protein